MIGDGEKYHYLAVTSLSVLLQEISNHKEDFYCLNCFNSYTSKNKLKEHEEICNNHNSCDIEMPEWVNKILKHNPGEKSLKKPFAIYLQLECILKKLQSIQNNPEKSYTEKKARHEPFSKCNLNYKVSKEIPIIIHNASYDTHFILEKLAKEFKGELNRIGDDMEKYMTFSVSIKKEVKNDDGNDDKKKKTITCKLKFIDS